MSFFFATIIISSFIIHKTSFFIGYHYSAKD